jgi:hypothetical protein
VFAEGDGSIHLIRQEVELGELVLGGEMMGTQTGVEAVQMRSNLVIVGNELCNRHGDNGV